MCMYETAYVYIVEITMYWLSFKDKIVSNAEAKKKKQYS
jgi:hypothetical protein